MRANVSLDEEAVRHVLTLARIDASDDEIERLRSDLGAILEYMTCLESAGGSIDRARDPAGERAMTLREDDVIAGLSPDEALRETSGARDGHYSAPRVAGDEDSA